MEDRDRYDNGAADQLPPDHPDLAAAPHPVDHEDHIGGATRDDLAVTDTLNEGTQAGGER